MHVGVTNLHAQAVPDAYNNFFAHPRAALAQQRILR